MNGRTATETIRIVIADDHAVVRRGLRDTLEEEPDMAVVGEAASGAEVLELAARLLPTVVLLDLRMPGADGVQIARQLRLRCPSARVLIFTSYEDDAYLMGALRAGAHGYLLKTTPPDRVVASVRAVAGGERLIGPELLDRVLSSFEALSQEHAQAASGLGPNEVAMLRLIAEGATNRQIAASLFWSEITVKRRLHDIFRKLGVTDRAQAVAEAMSRGLI
jgi:DNA-binding NarL/FixJ family response regulator